MITALLALLGTASADPCGMVPPVYTGQGPKPTIERIGEQQTYVFFADGIETIAIRPGFTGSAAEFGMLVPVPSAPALRKISDDTFAHLAAAVDPPKVTVRIQDPMPVRRREYAGMAPSAAVQESEAPSKSGLSYDAVRVVNQEAIGMYEVAVLEAGSPKALERWMSERDFRYPAGMDEVVFDYVDQGWLFVAIKARVGQMAGVTPRPGMRGVKPGLPSGANFSGHVQGMAFRFYAEEPVVPMRLSTFNGHDAMNTVYMVADRPVRIEDRSVSLVKRQVRGDELYAHLIEPLEVTYTGGKPSELTQAQRDQVEQLRDPTPYNRVARDLIASDLLALHTNTLSLPFEDEEKELLNINESLGLRGPQIDALVQSAMGTQRDAALSARADDLDNVVLTVLSGDFENRWLQENNLHFARWTLPEEKNTDLAWNRGPADHHHVFYREQSGWTPW